MVTRIAASEAFIFAIAASLVSRGSSSSTAVAAWNVSARAAATSASMSASLNCTPWWASSGLPNA